MTKENRAKNIKDREDRVVKGLDDTTSRLSELARSVGFGLAGLIVVFAFSDSHFSRYIMKEYWVIVFSLSLIGCGVIFLDYAQFVLAYVVHWDAKGRARNPDERLYENTSAFRWSHYFFVAKQVTAIVGALAFGIFLLYTLKHGGPMNGAQSGAQRLNTSTVSEAHGRC